MLHCCSLLQFVFSLPRSECLDVLAASIMNDRRKGRRRFERPPVFRSETSDGAIAPRVIHNMLSK